MHVRSYFRNTIYRKIIAIREYLEDILLTTYEKRVYIVHMTSH